MLVTVASNSMNNDGIGWHRQNTDCITTTMLRGKTPYSAIAFFLLCRPRMRAPAEMLASWVLDAESVTARSDALKYIADGDLGEAVAEQVRERGWLLNALHDSQLMKELTEEQKDRLRRKLIAAPRLEEAVRSGIIWFPPPPPLVTLETALNRLSEWWSSEGSNRALEYRRSLYPQDPRSHKLSSDPLPGRDGRSSWYILLALGSFQGMGHTREEQHRNFIRHCQDNGWWAVITGQRPKGGAREVDGNYRGIRGGAA